ncbi:MAG TPA: M23 family metallopeptidase [Methylomirabilota bacterium]|nr:M23 family metallopeptidase [Methylomirabilota bacterium]
MAKRRGFNLLVVKADGTRVLRVSVPRWAPWGALAAVFLAFLSVALIYGDYLSLRQQRANLSALYARLAEQQVVIEAAQARAREVRAEIDGWRELHARILEPFGPEAGAVKRGTGIGGGTGMARSAATGDATPVKEELERLVGLVKEEGDSLRALEKFLARAGKVLAALPSRWPVRGPVNSDFGRRQSPWASNSEFHSGLDIGAPVGTLVKAPAPGTVVFAGHHPEYGIALVIDHGNETKSLYGHLSKIQVGLNQKVQRGDVVALTGNTGRSSGPHLHYEIQVKGQPVNPNAYVWEDLGPSPARTAASR